MFQVDAWDSEFVICQIVDRLNSQWSLDAGSHHHILIQLEGSTNDGIRYHYIGVIAFWSDLQSVINLGRISSSMDRILANLQVGCLVKGKFPCNPGIELNSLRIGCKSTFKG